MDSTDLKRSTLQRKDREELTSIANALGGRPASRARKAELVDLILELAGAGNGESGAAAVDATESAPSNGSGSSDRRRAPRPPRPAAYVADPMAEARAAWQEETRPQPRSAEAGTGASAGTDDGAATEAASAQTEAGTGASAGPDDGAATEAASAQTEAGTGASAGTDDGAATEAANAQTEAGTVAGAGPEVGAQTPSPSVTEGDGSDAAGGSDGADTAHTTADAGSDTGTTQHDRDQGSRDDQEPGGRRRRRRGRDRDRDRDRGPQDDSQVETVEVAGHLDLRDEGYGFLRVKGYLASRDDAYVSVKQVRQFGLRKGDHLTGVSRAAHRNEKNPALLRIDTVNGGDPEQVKERRRFEELTPLFPDEILRQELEDDPANMTARIIDLLSPIGKGQRGLIVSPPKAGKTTIMKNIARSIELNAPEVHVIVLLVDERPEEVTDMRRWLLRGEVVASTFDRPADEHTVVAEMTIERAKRMVEVGQDVVIILDGITRLARAYNLSAPATGRLLSGGVDAGALYPPKRFFGAARNVEEGGSLTILATALVETGSKMDEVIFEEFKGTGNMELRLDRKTAERRIYPAIDVEQSSTRHEELLIERKQLQQVWKLRRVLSGLSGDGDGGGAAALELLIDRLKTFRTNAEFLAEVAKGPSMGG